MNERQSASRVAVWVSSLHAGGCAACAQSVTAALEAPQYARRLRAMGVTHARLPRHSDIILLSGALTEQARAALTPLIEGAPHPRALVAVGDCAINGCVFAGSAQLTTPLAQALAVNVEIGGCPPTPIAIIEALAEAQRLLGERLAVGAPPLIVTPTPPATSQPLAPSEGDAETPARDARLSALIQAAGEGWDDDDELDENDGPDDLDDPEANAPDALALNEDDHPAEPSADAPRPTVHHPEEKRR